MTVIFDNAEDTDPSTIRSNFNNNPDTVIKEIITPYPKSLQVAHNHTLSVTAHFDDFY